MARKDTTEASAVELDEAALAGAQGGATDFYLKLDGVSGEPPDRSSRSAPKTAEILKAPRIG